MKMRPTWERPKTSRVYLQTPGADRILLLQPDFKLISLALEFTSRHTRQSASGVLVLVGEKNSAPVDYEKTTFDIPKDGLPIYTIHNIDEGNQCLITMTAFASVDGGQIMYARISITNPDAVQKTGRIALLPRSAINGDQYLTGLWDTGYESYAPNWKQWLLQRINPFAEICADPATAAAINNHGMLRILNASDFHVRFISRNEQPNRFEAQDYYACDYTLVAGASTFIDIAFSDMPFSDVSTYDEAYADAAAYWQNLQARVTCFPKTNEPMIKDMFRQNITQCLQMLAQYHGTKGILARQGDVGRYIWIWEAIHYLMPLDKLGFHDFTRPAYETFLSWVDMDYKNRGKINYHLVSWDNAEGALIYGLSYHLTMVNDKALFETWKPKLLALISYIEKKRNIDESSEFEGLYPAGQSSDWGEIGKHWIYTDAFQVVGLRTMVEAFAKYQSTEFPYVFHIYESYYAAIIEVRNKLYAGHENDETYILPHIAGISFEESYNHCFYTDGAPFLPLLGFMDPFSRMFEQMEAFYRKNGLFDHGLAGRITNATDPGAFAYGDCYYTGIPELCWAYPWMARGEWEKVDAAAAAIFTYNVTREYIVSERYCSIDPWYTPWQPNGSGSGRLISFLLDYYDAKAAKQKEAAL